MRLKVAGFTTTSVGLVVRRGVDVQVDRIARRSDLSWLSLVRTLGEGVEDRLGLGRDAWLGCEALVADHDGSPRPTRPTAATKPSPRPAAQARLARSGPCQTPAPTGAAPARHADAHGPPRPEPQDQPRYAPIRCARSPTPADPAYA